MSKPTSLQSPAWLDDTVAANGQAVKDNFAAWFGKSRVVDAHGDPLIVHHGTRGEFDVFDHDFQGRNGSALGPGFYFTDSKAVAASYGDRLMSLFLKAENPSLSLTRKTITRKQVQKIIEDLEKEEPFFLSNHGEIGRTPRSVILASALEDIHGTSDNDAEVIGAIVRIGCVEQETVMQSVIARTGKDGFVVEADIASGAAQSGDKVYVVLSATQIKSALDNSGLFLPASASLSDGQEALRLRCAQEALGAVAAHPSKRQKSQEMKPT